MEEEIDNELLDLVENGDQEIQQSIASENTAVETDENDDRQNENREPEKSRPNMSANEIVLNRNFLSVLIMPVFHTWHGARLTNH